VPADAWVMLIGILVSVLTVLVGGMFMLVLGLTEHVAQINGKFTGISVWAQEHEKRDDERFNAIKDKLDRMSST